MGRIIHTKRIRRFARRWLCRNPLDNFRISRIATTALILVFFSATMVLIALSVSLFSDIWRSRNDEQDAKDDYNTIAVKYESLSIGKWVPGTVMIGGGGVVVEGGRAEKTAIIPSASPMGASPPAATTTAATSAGRGFRGASAPRSSIGSPINSAITYISRPASILTTPVPTYGSVDGVRRVHSVFAEASLPINITAPNMLVNFTFNLQNFTPPIVRFASLTRRMRSAAVCVPKRNASAVATTTAAGGELVGEAVVVSYDKSFAHLTTNDAATSSPSTPARLRGASSSSGGGRGVGAKGDEEDESHAGLCTEAEMEAHCEARYGSFASFVGSSFCRAGGCGDCYFYSFLRDYCLVVQSHGSPGSSGYRVLADPSYHSCRYPFTDGAAFQNYSWTRDVPSAVTVRVYKRDDPWIGLQAQTGGSCEFIEHNNAQTIVYLVCAAFAGVVSLGILWLLYSYMQAHYAFGANIFHANAQFYSGSGKKGGSSSSSDSDEMGDSANDSDNDSDHGGGIYRGAPITGGGGGEGAGGAARDGAYTLYSDTENSFGAAKGGGGGGDKGRRSGGAKRGGGGSAVSPGDIVPSANPPAPGHHDDQLPTSIGSSGSNAPIAPVIHGSLNTNSNANSSRKYGFDEHYHQQHSASHHNQQQQQQHHGGLHQVRNYNDICSYGQLPAHGVLPARERGAGGRPSTGGAVVGHPRHSDASATGGASAGNSGRVDSGASGRGSAALYGYGDDDFPRVSALSDAPSGGGHNRQWDH